MDIWQTDKLFLFFAFVIPGFISIKCYQLAFPGTLRATSDQLVDAVAYSSINYAILLPLIVIVETKGLLAYSNVLYYLFFLFVFFVAPIVWVLIWKIVRTRDFFQRNAPHPTGLPWDFVFKQRKPYWMKVTLTDGRIIAGRYGEHSFSSSAPAEPQVYLEETWLLSDKGAFERKQNNTAGVLIISKEISHIELRT